jgi:hypothetical protein
MTAALTKAQAEHKAVLGAPGLEVGVTTGAAVFLP